MLILSTILMISFISNPTLVFADTMGTTSASGMSTANNGVGQIELASFTAATSGTLQSITLFVPSPSGNGNVAIYANSGGSPGSLLAQGTSTALSAQVTFPIGGSISIVMGTVYWLAFETQSASYYYSGSGTGKRAWAIGTCCTLPNTITLAGSTTGTYAIYATYSTTTTTTTSSTTTTSTGPPPPLSFNVHAGATQVVVTVTWTGSGAVSVSISGPGGTPTFNEAAGTVYDRYAYAAESGTPTNIHRVTFNISANSPTSPQTWTVLVSPSGSYTVVIEVS
jgi:hypothetical protein